MSGLSLEAFLLLAATVIIVIIAKIVASAVISQYAEDY